MTNISRHDGRIPTNDPELWALFWFTAVLLALLAHGEAEHMATSLTGALAALQAAHLIRQTR